MRLFMGVIISLVVGACCRVFDIPVPSPPVLPGALLVVAMTLGYSGTDRFFSRTTRVSSTRHLCGGPSGETVSGKGRNRGLPASLASWKTKQ